LRQPPAAYAASLPTHFDDYLSLCVTEMTLNPIPAFAVAILASLVWFGAVVTLLSGGQPTPTAHIAILLTPVFLSGLLQFFSTRQLALSKARRAVQVGASALLAPVLATTIIWLIWVVLLGHGE
jgi:hypothetical protein